SGSCAVFALLFFVLYSRGALLYPIPVPTRRSSDLQRMAQLRWLVRREGFSECVDVHSRILYRSGVRRQRQGLAPARSRIREWTSDRKSTRLNSSHLPLSPSTSCSQRQNRRVTCRPN